MKHVLYQAHMLNVCSVKFKLTMSKVRGPHGFAIFPDLPALTGKFSEANYLAGEFYRKIGSANHLWTANHNIINT